MAQRRNSLSARSDSAGVTDLHQGGFDADEYAITVGVELFTAAALIDGEQRQA
jgi:amidohydrolase